MSDKIETEHRQRLALVYVRQSSPGQVRQNVESGRVQRGMARRARALGWRASQIRVVEGDQAESASLPQSRSSFGEMVELVRGGAVGIIFASEMSRLARNDVDWAVLVHYCQSVGTLLADEQDVFNPAAGEDRFILGIRGVLAVHECDRIRERMERAKKEKASRGELHPAVPPGYVCVERKHLRKHPDRRVQHAVAHVFAEFERCSSVRALARRLWETDAKLPVVPHGKSPNEVEWVDAHSDRLLDMLQNIRYAGTYAYGCTKTVTTMGPDNRPCKKVRRVAREDWEVELPNNHPAYITLAQYEANQKKIAMNANEFAPRAVGAPQDGRALLVGLIDCRRCGHRMAVRYRSSGAVVYACRGGRRQREGGGPRCCFTFRANEFEARLVEQILYAVSPAGVAAAERAADRLAEQWQDRRRVLEDACAHERYLAGVAERRFKAVDPANELVFESVAAEYEVALERVREQEARRAAFEEETPVRPTAAQREALLHLGRDLERAWFHPKAEARLKKQLVRALIEHVYADVDEDSQEVVLWVQWAGGHHTELREPRGRRAPPRNEPDLKTILETLRKVADDEQLARILNRSSLRTPRGKTWSKRSLSQFRQRHEIAAFCRAEKEREGWLLQSEAAEQLEVSPMSVHRLIEQGVLPAERHRGLPSVVRRADLAQRAVRRAVSVIRSHGLSRLPDDPAQLRLF